jgi:phosphoribosylaminoimidazole carboxylase (NCAIR synthetase)
VDVAKKVAEKTLPKRTETTPVVRKMGHITVIGKTVKHCIAQAKKARRYIQI